MNRFEKKKNVTLAIDAFALLRARLPSHERIKTARLVLAGMASSNALDT